MKILVVCQYYFPETFQITSICESFVNDGYEVTVLTGLPNYPTGIIPYEYKYKHRKEDINGVHIIRCAEVGRKNGILYLALNYISFYLSSMIKVSRLADDFDLVFCYQLSPVLMGLSARKYAIKHKVPMILYCCDLWPESMKMYINNEKNVLFRYIKHISKKVYSSANKIICQSKSFIKYIEEIHGIHESRLVYIPAFADEDYLLEDYTLDNGVVDFVFLGNLGIAQNLFKVLEAVKKIKTSKRFCVHFVGDGACYQDLKKYVANNNLNGIVKFYGKRPKDEMPFFYRLADVCLVSLNNNNKTGFTLPIKVQGYMAAGKPILGMIDGSTKDIIEESKCGICVQSNDVDSFADALKQMIYHSDKFKEYGLNGREYFKKNFRKGIVINKIEHEFLKVLS